MGFCFAQRFHPAMRFVGPVRKELGVPTVFNFLGPLTNPARTRHQLVGVSDPAMAPDHGRGLRRHRQPRTLIVHADDGLDELSVTSPADRPRGPRRRRRRLRGDRVAGRPAGARARRRPPWPTCAGGDAAFNADVIRSVLEGERGARRDIGILNAAAALIVAGRVDDLRRAGAGRRVHRQRPRRRRARRAGRYVPRRAAPPAGLTRQARRGPWASGPAPASRAGTGR